MGRAYDTDLLSPGDVEMHYTKVESGYFYWHCRAAAQLLENLPLNTATRVHVHNAIRMATLNAVGKNGIRLASKDAAAQLDRNVGKAKTKGLLREHVVPVSVIAAEVESAWVRIPIVLIICASAF